MRFTPDLRLPKAIGSKHSKVIADSRCRHPSYPCARTRTLDSIGKPRQTSLAPVTPRVWAVVNLLILAEKRIPDSGHHGPSSAKPRQDYFSSCQVMSRRTGISFLMGMAKRDGGLILKSETVAGIVPVMRMFSPSFTN